ncbi:MAG: Stp1/IreP family PP2C-type Ser/Thr phosphatase [Actinobacteria bacterium]|nr:Stp1/IreP family PP2C-type Ser/Thr phosphatase [Actinomycetota bacterium]MBA3566407.1 Stp1/IreP family PP2C-type Ser/Thr phosphatase [Actinomycetota bacterium]MDQ3086120.1 Stp1/IreP family PP2C-type Ser/Thr phosphatase [Actinomycetota bacterium]
MKIGRAAGVTDTGRRRLRNEDAFICEPPLFAVADGMGGARAGEVAAGLAAAALEEAGSETRGAEGVAALIVEANKRIWERSLNDPRTTGMGTTVTAALVDAASGAVAIGHVGDSRAYLLRDETLEQLTTDHSLVAELVESGVLTPEEAERHPQRSAITRALGTEPTVEVDAFTMQAEPGDLFLVCSDGLSAMLSDEAVSSAIETADRDPERAADALVAAANARGGEDNITVVLFEIVDDQAPAPSPVPEPVPEATVLPEAGELTEEDVQVEASESVAAEPEPSRHGAGAGGRVAALALIVSVLVVGLLVLYLAVR